MYFGLSEDSQGSRRGLIPFSVFEKCFRRYSVQYAMMKMRASRKVASEMTTAVTVL